MEIFEFSKEIYLYIISWLGLIMSILLIPVGIISPFFKVNDENPFIYYLIAIIFAFIIAIAGIYLLGVIYLFEISYNNIF